MRARSVILTFLLAILGSSGCSSNALLSNRNAPRAGQTPQIESAPNTRVHPPLADAHESPAEATAHTASGEHSLPAGPQKVDTAPAATPPAAVSASIAARSDLAPSELPAPVPPPAPSASGDSDQRWLDVLEKDVDKAVEQPPERRHLHFSKEVIDHPRVRHFIEHYSTTAKQAFKELLSRSGKYMPMIARVLNEEGLPQELGYLALIESAFVVDSASPNGAVGLWQMIAPTARKYGLRIDRWVDERRDPVKSTRAAAAYLKDLHDYYGRWFLATAAYNTGPGNIDKALRQTNAKDFWSIRAKARLSDETRDFVPKFVAIALLATDPHSYGFHEVRYHPPMYYEEVQVPGPMNLASLAKLSETAVSEIRELNPALLRASTPPGAKGYGIRLPAEKAAIFLAKAKAKSPADNTARKDRVVTHEVKRGETLFSIARFYGLSVRALMHFNGLTSSRLRAGQKLQILLAGLQRSRP